MENKQVGCMDLGLRGKKIYAGNIALGVSNIEMITKTTMSSPKEEAWTDDQELKPRCLQFGEKT